MGSPYRERRSLLLCPRCGELLDPTHEAVSSCLRCEGLWISPATLDAAFTDPRWPAGQALWWRNPIECPECAFEGRATVMTARRSSDVIVDQCPDHGVWLDRGELGRLMGAPADELEALRARLAVIAPDLDQLVARRERWRTGVEIRRKAALERRHELDEEQRRRAKLGESEQLRLAATAQAATAPTQILPATRRAAGSDPPPPSARAIAAGPAPRTAARRQRLGTLAPAEVSAEAAQQAASRMQELGSQRAQTSADVGILQGRLVALEDHIRRLEAQLDETRRYAVSVRAELDGSRTRLRTLDEQLDGPANTSPTTSG